VKLAAQKCDGPQYVRVGPGAHPVPNPRRYCMDACTRRRDDAHMPRLTDAELATAATACRAMAYQEGERAKKMENPTTRGPIEDAAQRYAALAERFEAARRRTV
jgi:hypothetical protein